LPAGACPIIVAYQDASCLACPGCSAGRAPARSGKYSEDALRLLHKLLAWPAPQLFPALDLARLAALDAAAAEKLAASAGAVSLESEAGAVRRLRLPLQLRGEATRAVGCWG
jgi:hypothetical protein